MPSAFAPGGPHKQPADAPRESALPEDDAAIQRIAALTRDLAALHYERSCAKEAKDEGEAVSIADAIARTQEEIAALTQDPAMKEHFERYRREQFSLVHRVHDLQRTLDHIEALRQQERTLSRQYSSRRPSSHAREKILFVQQEQSRLQEEMDQALQKDSTLTLAWRSWQLREYRRQLRKDHFAETPSRRLLMNRLSALLADERKVLLTGPTGTGKTELAKHTLRPLSGEPEILSGHQGLTSYDVYGKPILTTSPDGATVSSFHLGAFPRAAKDGRGLIIDEIDLIPTQTLLRHKADWNLRVGDTLKIQEDASANIPIQKGFGVVATANIKGVKHKEREVLDPAVTRLFEPLPVPYFPREELYDLSLATLIDRRGFLPLSHADAAETLKNLVDAASDIQDAYLGRSTAFYEKGGRSTNKVASLEKAVLDPGRLLTLLSGFPRASLSGCSFRSFLHDELAHFVNNEDYSPKDRFTLLDILTTHGFLVDRKMEDFLPSNFTSEEWQRHLEAHPPLLSASERATADKSSSPMLDPLAVAALDPYHQRAITAAAAAEELLGGAPSPEKNSGPSLSLPEAIAILGSDKVFGPEAVQKTFHRSLTPAEIPPIPFTRRDLERAKALNQRLVLRVTRFGDGAPVTMQTLHERLAQQLAAKGQQKILHNTDWYKGEDFFTTETTRCAWALISADPLPDSASKDYVQQMDLLARHVEEERKLGAYADPQWTEALREWREYRAREFAGLAEEEINASLQGDERYAEEFSTLSLNTLARHTPVEALYDMCLLLENGDERLLCSLYTWTPRRSADGRLVGIGFFDALGAGVSWWRPWNRIGGLGVSLSRSR